MQSHLQSHSRKSDRQTSKPTATLRKAAKVSTGLIAAFIGFLSPRVDDVAPDTVVSARDAQDGARTGFRVPQLASSARASMHVSTIANLTTVLRFKAGIMTKSSAEISSFMQTLHSEAAAARVAGDTKAILRSTKRLMVLNEALRDRIVALEKTRK